MFQRYLEHITLNNYAVLPSPSYSQTQSNGFHTFVAHHPRVVCTRRPTPESVLLAILRTKPQSSSKQQVEEGQAICIPQSCPSRDTAQPRECQVQRETLDAGGMGEPFFSSSKLSNGTVEIASGRPQNAQIQLRAL